MAESWSFFTDGGYFLPAGDAEFSSPENNDSNANNNFPVEDLLDFPLDGDVITGNFFDSVTGDDGGVTAVNSCNSFSGGSNINCLANASEICVPYDDLAELEWLSNFVEHSFSSGEIQNLHLVSATRSSETSTPPPPPPSTAPSFPSSVSVPSKARTKRRRLNRHSPATSSTNSATVAANPGGSDTSSKTVRRCLHCASEKTPQWRTGPLGPKTLCNACGVRYKSGRLVPEYRPASSPTFVAAKHSNSHRSSAGKRSYRSR